MKIKAQVDINPTAILRARGLGDSTEARKSLASDVKRLCDPYVPKQQGDLKNRAVVAEDGSAIIYTQPYAHYQYYGEVMAGRPPKRYTGAKLTYHGAPMRGARWAERMLADRGREVADNLKKYIARKGRKK